MNKLIRNRCILRFNGFYDDRTTPLLFYFFGFSLHCILQLDRLLRGRWLTPIDERPNTSLFAQDQSSNTINLVLTLFLRMRGNHLKLQRSGGEGLKAAIVKVAQQADALSTSSNFFQPDTKSVVLNLDTQTRSGNL